jgi:hypothetical protein
VVVFEIDVGSVAIAERKCQPVVSGHANAVARGLLATDVQGVKPEARQVQIFRLACGIEQIELCDQRSVQALVDLRRCLGAPKLGKSFVPERADRHLPVYAISIHFVNMRPVSPARGHFRERRNNWIGAGDENRTHDIQLGKRS